MISQIPSKTYSRKRRRALSNPTDSPSTSSPFPLASVVRDRQRTCTTTKHIAKSGVSESTEVSPERPSKKMKRHSSSTATPSTRLGIPSMLSSVPCHSALTSESLPLASLTTSDTKSSYPSLLTRNANDIRLPSTSEHIKSSSTSPLHQPESGLKQSNAGQPLPFRRTRSQTQKENVLAHPQTLGSPFQIAHTSSLRPHTSDTKAAKQLRSSRFVRRPSADIFRAHTSSSTSFRRRPSGSHALQKKSTQNQDWLVAPPRIFPSANENTAKLDPEIDINRSHSFFSPQGSSTPLPLKRSIHYGTPMTPTPSIPSGNKESSPRPLHDSVMSDTKSTPKESSVQSPGPASDLYTSSPREPGVIGNSQESHTPPPHRVLHLPHDSIFSSFEVSASATTVRVLVDPRLAHDEVVEERDEQLDLLRSMPDSTGTSPVPRSNKLHDMFSVLALAEQRKPSEDSGIGLNKMDGSLNVELIKGGKSDCGSPQNMEASPSKGGVADKMPTVQDEKMSATRKRKQKRVAGGRSTSSSAHQNVPKHVIRVCADNEPLIAGDDEEDELLLTSKGWDWDPQ